MKSSLAIITALALGISPTISAQNNVEIKWQNPTEYRDVRPTSGTRQGFMDSTFRNIDKYMHKLAESLPAEHKLLLTVSDLDLAGQVWPASFAGFGRDMSEIRVIKRIDMPRITFSYQLLTTGGKIIQQAEVKLTDMTFMERGHARFNSDSLRYEKAMLKRWFNKEFAHLLDQPPTVSNS